MTLRDKRLKRDTRQQDLLRARALAAAGQHDAARDVFAQHGIEYVPSSLITKYTKPNDAE